MTGDDKEPVGGYKAPSEFTGKLYELLKELNKTHPLEGGVTGTFWHVIYTVDEHLK